MVYHVVRGYLWLTLALCVLIICGCSADKTRTFITGSYVNSAGSDYSVANDTLALTLADGNHYRIERRTGYRLVRNGKLGKTVYETEQWQAVYDPESRLMRESARGKLLTFYPDSGYLLVGKRRYDKLK